MTPEQKLNALFATEAPPALDYRFQAAVVERIARRRAWATVAALVPWVIAASALLWGLQPVLGPILADLGPELAPAAMALTIVGLSLAAADRVVRFLARI
ncbi:hypothetical protein [uncultured Brevundimonas sp.]|uniref:hypothetical protein n=1 Tax=uncultured Brevundimonas sp. TaxID=213418 RepID=UPI0030EE4EE5|tara:strand:+ start:4169 stop:4468 length:300 start_codon:yes stop_codon:yes gene_type:complete